MHSNCTICGMFKPLNRLQICSPCFKDDTQLLELAKDRIKTDGKMQVFELADKIQVLPERIFMWLQQRRIKRNFFKHVCPKCGRDLLNGFCQCSSHHMAEEAKANLIEASKPKEQFHSASRADKLKRNYWDKVSIIRRKQKRDIWIPS